MNHFSQMEKIGVLAIATSVAFLIIEAMKVKALSAVTPYGSFIFAAGVVLFIIGFYKRKDNEKKKED